MGLKTSLYDLHLAGGAKMIDFGGWDMPLHYGSQIEEHHAVRKNAGLFDISHMTVVDVAGADARDYLRHLLANDVDRLQIPGKAQYSAMCNTAGGVLDDLVVYRLNGDFRMVVNSATGHRDLAWMRDRAEGRDVSITERTDLAILALQGPRALAMAARRLPGGRGVNLEALETFQSCHADGWFIARTGYTGEDGLEIILPGDQAPALWRALVGADICPVGLGARDTLRLEAGMNLYGADLDEGVSPLEANMGWTLAWEPADRDFVGRASLARQLESSDHRIQVGLVLRDRGVLRSGQQLHIETDAGRVAAEITSGSFSPTLGFSVALARMPRVRPRGAWVEMRGRDLAVEVVRPRFVHQGKNSIRPLH